jgi:hypothetical protein
MAAALWMLAPNEIEADLAFRGIDIGWWHRYTLGGDGFPKLSSRRLIALLEALPEDSGYKTVRRNGQWPLWMQMVKEIHKESALVRASTFAGGDTPESEELSKYTVFMDPVEARETSRRAEAEKQQTEDETAQLYAALGWT